jgi:hypothetical protein
MSLTARTKTQLVDKVNTCFTNIGITNGAKMPRSGDNREPIACKANAEDAAVKAGLILDKEANPRPSGTKEVLFNGELVSISLEVRKASTRVDVDKLIAFLASKKIPAALLTEAVDYATFETRPAHVFDPVLITDA